MKTSPVHKRHMYNRGGVTSVQAVPILVNTNHLCITKIAIHRNRSSNAWWLLLRRAKSAFCQGCQERMHFEGCCPMREPLEVVQLAHTDWSIHPGLYIHTFLFLFIKCTVIYT